MNNFSKLPALLTCALLFAVTGGRLTASDPPAEQPGSDGSVSRVVLYRGQALITRQVKLAGAPGSREVVVTGLPNSIVAGSLYAESTSQLEVRAVRFRQRSVGQEPRDEVRRLDAEIADVQSALALNGKKTELAVQKIAFLDQLQGFVAPTAHLELSHGVLNSDTLKQLTQFSFEQRNVIAEEQVNLDKERQQLNDRLQLLQRSRGELTSTAQRTVNEAVLFVEKLAGGEQDVELNYLVENCGWSPTYTFRASDDRARVLVEYNALIQQLSGEDWAGVHLTLSTASPALSASGPSLAPFNISLVGQEQSAQPPAAVRDGSQLSLSYAENRAQQQAANQQLGSLVDFQSKTSVNWSLNKLAYDNQQMELANSMEALSTIFEDGNTDDTPSLSYELAGPVSLASRSDQQMVRIFRGDLSSQFFHVATPLLSSYVYREAEIHNVSDFDFLAGPATVYIDNRFVGRAEIPTVAQGEIFVLGFGSDAQVRARRELVEKTEGVQGGNKEVKMQYRVVIENYKATDVRVRVLDRLPFTNRASDIRVTPGEPTIPLSSDPTYQRRERPKNILRWDVNVPAEASGEKAFEIRYAFTLDYDRNFAISGTSNDPSDIREFQQLERMRQKL